MTRDPRVPRRRCAGTLAVACGGLLLAAPFHARAARASETQYWVVDSAADLAKAEARGIVVDPDGVMSLGSALREWKADSLTVIWAIARLADGSVAVAGDRGRIDRWTEKAGFQPWVRLGGGQVLSLAASPEGLVAGTGPDGSIFRVTLKGDTTRLARTGERYVWGLAPGVRGDWYAATGTRGKLMRLSGGKMTVVLDSDESNLVSIVSDGKGGVFAGGDSKGRVFHALADGSVRTVMDASEDEIRSLAIGADGALYAAALSGSAVEGEGETERPTPAKSAVANARSVIYRIVPDSSVTSWWTSAQPFVFALARTPQGLVAATGNRSGLYRLDRPGAASQLAALPQGQITALALEPDGGLLAATSNPGSIWRLGPARASRGELLSPTLDARRVAAFGRIRWTGEAGSAVRLEARSGNCDPPDTTWSPWKGGRADADGIAIDAPPARYLQWKLVLEDGRARVSSIEAAWRERNVAPRVEDLVVAPQGVGFREGELSPHLESVTQSLPGGQKVEYSMSPGSTPKALRELPMWALGLRTLQWRGTDANGDPLTYRVETRAEGTSDWIELGKDLTSTSFTWDTRGLPDGRYRIRVTADDHQGNAIGEEATGFAVSEPFLVDNSPPRISRLDLKPEKNGVRFEGEAEDDTSILTRIEASLDNDDWRTVSPEGGMADARRLRFSSRWPDVKPGAHTLSVRAVDAGGNSVVRAARLTVPGGK